MKFITFDGANAAVPTTDGQSMPFHNNGQNGIILCVEVDKQDLQFIKDTGRIYVAMDGFELPPPIGVLAFDPFKLKLPTNGKEDKNKNGAGDDGKSNNGDSKLSIA